MKRETILTNDGSATIRLPGWDEQYHSIHGAIGESYHVFIRNGLDFLNQKETAILEMGFGTGLNAYITLLESQKRGLKVRYTTLEAYPLSESEVKSLNYASVLEVGQGHFLFDTLHSNVWGMPLWITTNFELLKLKMFFEDIKEESQYDLVYFDAFSPRVQPDLWGEAIFTKMYKALKCGGVLVTYCAKGSVRRIMQKLGFVVERLTGPPGKREMLRAVKKQ